MTEEFVQSLARGLSVIGSFDAEHGSMTLSEVATRTDLSRATARRLLLTLVELGYVRSDARHFELTPQVLRLGTAYLSGMGLPALAQPHLERLSAEVGESTSLAVLDDTEIVYVARVATRRLMSVGITVGTRFPAYATSMGRVLLAGLGPADRERTLAASELVAFTPCTLTDVSALIKVLDEVAASGHAAVDEELESGLRSVAVPVRDGQGALVAAINISSPTSMDASRRSGFVAALERTATAIEDDLVSTGSR